MDTTITITPDDPVGETARKLVAELCAEMAGRYGAAPSPFSSGEAAAPRTIFLVARLGDKPVGCGALRRFDDETAEIKRMYVAPAGRRRGIARRILSALERCAHEFHYRAIRLETGVRQPEAQALYESMGFRRIAAFGPYIGNPTSICFEKTLTARRPEAPEIQIRRVEPADLANQSALADALADVLLDCVEGGASIGFMLPLSREKAVDFWQGVLASVRRKERILLVAEETGAHRIVGTVQVVLTTPDNQPHRADIAKMQVHPRARRRGVGAALLRGAEAAAAEEGRTVLVLDTVTGGDAERLYTRLGWQRCGVIPNYALWPAGGYCNTTVLYRLLTSDPALPEKRDQRRS